MGVPSDDGVVLATTSAAVFVLLLCGFGTPTAMAAGGGAQQQQYYGDARYKDPRQPLNRRIDDLLGRMTLTEKIGQMSQIERENATADVVRGYFVGTHVTSVRMAAGVVEPSASVSIVPY